MVLRLSRRQISLAAAAVLAVLFCLPYLSSGFLAIEHDTFFHLSRIQGLADAIRRGDLLPALYPYKNNGFGYASPLFYCDLLLTPFSLLYLAGLPLAWAYKLVIFCATWFSAYAVLRMLMRITGDFPAPLAVTAAFVFSNYRITDVYVRGALGEMMAIGFLAVCVSGLYDLLEQSDTRGGFLLWSGLCGLICSHNLTFVFGAVTVMMIVLCFIKQIRPAVLKSGITAVLLAFLCTAWFTLPMLEQLSSQRFILNYYAESSRLERYALPLWKYIANRTVFGFGENDIERNRQMLVNIGLPLTILALAYPFAALTKQQAQTKRFITAAWIIGLFFFLFPMDIFPWSSMQALRVIQFPWRLMTPALVLLCIPACAALRRICRAKKEIVLCLGALFVFEGLYHLHPAFDRPFGITSSDTYETITSGDLIDPYYSATYMRVELAGGDYLPAGSPDFRTEVPAVRTRDGSLADAEYRSDNGTMYVTVRSVPEDGILELPLTFYKGYVCSSDSGNIPQAEASYRGLVQIRISAPGTVTVRYEGTPLRKICIVLSAVCTAAALLIYKKSFLRSSPC